MRQESSVPQTPERLPMKQGPFFTPFITNRRFRKFSQSDFQKKFEKFLADAYIHIEIPARQKVSELTPDSHVESVDLALQARIDLYGIEQLKEMRRFYREFSLSIAVIMKGLEQLSREVPPKLIDETIRGFEKPIAADSSFDSKDKAAIERNMMMLAARLNCFNLHIQEILAAQKIPAHSTCYNTKLAWVFYMALLGLAVGVSLHFIPILGAAIAIPVAVQWLALLINMTVPALTLTVSSGLAAYLALTRVPPQSKASLSSQESLALESSAEKLLVQVMRAEMIADGRAQAVTMPHFDLAIL